MLLSNFWEVTKGKLGNPYWLPKISTVLHEFTSLMQQHLISKAIRPLDWIQTHPKSVPSSFLGPVLPQELTMETVGSPDNHIVGANGIPRRGMSSPWWPPLHLLRQSWGPNRLLLTVVKQSRWIFKQLCNADLKVNADKFDILCTLTEYLKVLTSNRPQSNKA